MRSDGGKKAGHRGELEGNRQNHCAGKAGLLPLNLYARVRSSIPFARETAGAARTRLSLRPLVRRAGEERQNPGELRRGIARCIWCCLRCELVRTRAQLVVPANAAHNQKWFLVCRAGAAAVSRQRIPAIMGPGSRPGRRRTAQATRPSFFVPANAGPITTNGHWLDAPERSLCVTNASRWLQVPAQGRDER